MSSDLSRSENLFHGWKETILKKTSSWYAEQKLHAVFLEVLTHIEERKKKVIKGVWRMPWLLEAKKDVISCDKLRGSANRNYIRRFPNGATQCTEGALFIVR